MKNESEIHFVKVPLSQLKKLRNDPKFILILQLGRYINQLMYFHKVYLANDDGVTPVGVRHTHNSFFFMCAILYEALKIIGPLGSEFRSYRTFRNGFAKLSKNADMNDLKTKVLNKMRNEFIFHVDPKPFEEALQTYDLRLIDFVTTTTGKQGDNYFNLSDELVLNYIIGDHGSAKAEREYYAKVVKKVGDVMAEFIRCANSLIYEYIDRKLWKPETRPLTKNN